MAEYDGPEKRSTARMPLTTFCPVLFSDRGVERSALMTDLSEKGARVRLEEHGARCGLREGDTVVLRIRTPYGTSTCSGRVNWATHIDGHLNFGVTFTDLSSDPKDPLTSFIDSLF